MLIKHTLLYMPTQVLVPLIQIVGIVLWGHLLAPEAVGFITLLVAFQEIYFSASFRWWTQYVMRFQGAAASAGEPEFLKSESFVIAVVTLIQIAVSCLFLALTGDAGQDVSVVLIVGFLVSRNILNYLWERARARMRIGLYSFLQIGGIGVGFVFGLLLIVYQSADATSVLLGFTIAQGLALAVGLVATDTGRAIGRPSTEILGAAFKYGAPVMVGQFLNTFTLNAPRFIVAKLLGLEAAGIFAIGYGVGMRISSLAVMMVTPGAYPLAVRKMQSEGVEAGFAQLRQNIAIVYLVLFPSALGLMAINDQLIALTVAPAMQAATLLILPAATIAGMMRYLRSHTTEQAFLLTGHTMTALKISVFDCVLCVAMTLAGVHFYGLTGGALLPIVSGLFSLILSDLAARRVIHFKLPYAALAQVALSALVMYGVLVVIRHYQLQASAMNVAILVAVGALVYTLMLVLVFRSQIRTMLPFKRKVKP